MRRALEVLAMATRLGLTSFGGPVALLGYFRQEHFASGERGVSRGSLGASEDLQGYMVWVSPLAFPLVHVDANMVHGWPPSPAPVSAWSFCGALYATTSGGGQPLHPLYPLASRARAPVPPRLMETQLATQRAAESVRQKPLSAKKQLDAPASCYATAPVLRRRRHMMPMKTSAVRESTTVVGSGTALGVTVRMIGSLSIPVIEVKNPPPPAVTS